MDFVKRLNELGIAWHLMRVVSNVRYWAKYGRLTVEIMYLDVMIDHINPAKKAVRKILHMPLDAFGRFLMTRRTARNLVAWVLKRPAVRREMHKTMRELREAENRYKQQAAANPV
ncbi:MAG TPA: hypothetical protein VF450_13100 [Noviherbaspirillum sp.]